MVTDQQSESKGGEANNASAPLSSYSEIFHEFFPDYLAMGMSVEEYWDGDSTLTKDFRKAYKIRKKQKNQEMWMQGMYIYEALCCVSPLMQAFAKKGTKAHPYRTEPYPITKQEALEMKHRNEQRAMEESIERMKAFASNYNKRFEKKGDE